MKITLSCCFQQPDKNIIIVEFQSPKLTFMETACFKPLDHKSLFNNHG